MVPECPTIKLARLASVESQLSHPQPAVSHNIPENKLRSGHEGHFHDHKILIFTQNKTVCVHTLLSRMVTFPGFVAEMTQLFSG